MRVAYFTPVSPQKTGISDYTEKEMLPYISNYIDVDLFIDNNVEPTNHFIVNNFNIYSIRLSKKKGLLRCGYISNGNNAYHKFIYDSLIKNSGITVLHDIYLHGFFRKFQHFKRK